MKWAKLGKNIIRDIQGSELIEACCLKDKKFKNFINKIVNKFLNCNWGLITKKDKEINNIMLNGNYSGIVGVYKHKRYGAFMLSLFPLEEVLTITSIETEGWKVVTFKRFKVFNDYDDTW